MKPKSSLLSFLALCGSSLLAYSTAQADTLYWDGGSIDIAGNGNGASGGGAGTWNTTLKNWDAGAVPYVAWGSGDYAVIAGSAATITVGSGVVTGGIDFLGNGYVLDATSNGMAFTSGSNQLRLAGNNWAATINGAISGSGDMLIQSIFASGAPGFNPTPQINFGGTSTGGWEGHTTINRGITLHMSSNDNQALNSTSGITLQGGIIQITNTEATAAGNNRINDDAAIIVDGGGAIRIANTNLAGNAYSESIGDVTLNSGYLAFSYTTNLNTAGTTQTLTLNSFDRNNHSVVSFGPSANSAGVIQITGATETPAGQIIGPWAVHGNGNTNNDFARINASGQVVALAAANNNTEASWSTSWSNTANTATNANQTLTADRAFNTLRVANNNGTLGLGDNTLAAYGILNGAGNYTINAGASGFITIPSDNGDGALYLHSGNGNLTVNAPIKDNGSNKLTLVLGSGGSGNRIDLNGDSDYTGGTVISRSSVRNSATSGAGAVQIGHNNAFGAVTNYLQFDSGLINLNGFSVTVGEFSSTGPSASLTNNTGTGRLTVGNGITDSTSVSDFNGSIVSGLITKTGAGTQILSGINAAAATGQYTVEQGTLQFAKVDSFYAGSVVGAPATGNWTKARTIVNSGATLAFNVGGTGEFSAAQLNTIMTNLGGSNAAGTEGFQAGSRLGLDTTNALGGTFTVANAIADSTGAGGGAIGLTKLGTGTLVMSNSSTYTGDTIVSAGTLLVNGSLGTTAVTVNSGAFGGSGIIGSTLDLVAGSFHIVDLFDALQVAGTVNIYNGFGVADLTGITWGSVADGTYTLIDGTLGAGVFDGLANTSVGTAYNLGGGKSAYFQEGSLQLVVTTIPEPSAALLGAFGLLALLRRRR